MISAPESSAHRHLPDINQLSIITATILLTYSLVPLIKLPENFATRLITFQIIGFVYSINLTLGNVISLLVSISAAMGMDWMIRSHPAGRNIISFPHWILPGLAAWVIGIPLNSLEMDIRWWGVFVLGGVLLVLVFTAEYIIVDPNDTRTAPAIVILTAVSFALFLIICISLRASNFRLYLVLPSLAVAVFFASLRTLFLRTNGRWCFNWAAVITILVGQISVGLHYLPISPIRFGLVLLGTAYALTSLAGSIEEGNTWRSSWLEPVIMMILFISLALIVKG
ncbi:MAG TPA: hypothetical protein VIO61_14170 [Anaerolineaceae bacterium]